MERLLWSGPHYASLAPTPCAQLSHKSVCETKTKTQKSSQCPNPKPRAIMLQCGGNRLLQEHGSDGFALPYGVMFVYVASLAQSTHGTLFVYVASFDLRTRALFHLCSTQQNLRLYTSRIEGSTSIEIVPAGVFCSTILQGWGRTEPGMVSGLIPLGSVSETSKAMDKNFQQMEGGISSDLPFRSPSGDIRTDVMAGVVAHAFNT